MVGSRIEDQGGTVPAQDIGDLSPVRQLKVSMRQGYKVPLIEKLLRSLPLAASFRQSSACAPRTAAALAKWRSPRFRDSRRRPTPPTLAVPTQCPEEPYI
jgi:hypothetical protein